MALVHNHRVFHSTEDPTVKLYLKPGACSLSPHIVLEEAGLSYETEVVDLASKVTATGANYLTINPKGYVPALLLDSGELLTEGPAIVQYLADLVPAKKLSPANGTGRLKLSNPLRMILMSVVVAPMFTRATV